MGVITGPQDYAWPNPWVSDVFLITEESHLLPSGGWQAGFVPGTVNIVFTTTLASLDLQFFIRDTLSNTISNVVNVSVPSPSSGNSVNLNMSFVGNDIGILFILSSSLSGGITITNITFGAQMVCFWKNLALTKQICG